MSTSTQIRVTALAAAAAVLAGCAESHRASGPDLAGRLDPTLGGPLPVVASATGPMDLALAARSTALPADDLRGFLSRNGFQGGHSRVWRRGEEFVTALVFRFFAERGARGFVTHSLERLSTSAAYADFADPQVPQGRGFLLTSVVSGSTRFCVGEYFTVAREAFLVTRCAPFPLSAPTALTLGRQAYAHAVKEPAS